MSGLTKGSDETQTAFTIRVLRAEAWDEGYREAIEDYGCDIPWGGMTSESNPYANPPAPEASAGVGEGVA